MEEDVQVWRRCLNVCMCVCLLLMILQRGNTTRSHFHLMLTCDINKQILICRLIRHGWWSTNVKVEEKMLCTGVICLWMTFCERRHRGLQSLHELAGRGGVRWPRFVLLRMRSCCTAFTQCIHLVFASSSGMSRCQEDGLSDVMERVDVSPCCAAAQTGCRFPWQRPMVIYTIVCECVSKSDL